MNFWVLLSKTRFAFGTILMFVITMLGTSKASAFQVLNRTCGEITSNITRGPNGVLYGVSSSAENCSPPIPDGFVFSLTPDPATRQYTFADLYNFTGAPDSGNDPQAEVAVDPQGNIYGSTLQGGASDQGIIYKLAADGTFTIIHSFTGPEGSFPEGRILLDGTGHLFGAASGGGIAGGGSIWEATTDGLFRILHRFTNSEGGGVTTGLIMDQSGVLYGVGGGGPAFDGILFSLTPDGTLTTLHAFSGNDGSAPEGTLVMDGNGDLYGTTSRGGACGGNPLPLGYGTIFKYSLSTNIFTTLYSFGASSGCRTNPADGDSPQGELALDSAGNVFGTTQLGGGNPGKGTVFQLAADGSLTTLHSFASPITNPIGGVMFNTNQTILFGTASSGQVFGLAP